MKYIKTYEELKPETYASAADKLSKMGHKKRPEELINWSNQVKLKNVIQSVKTIGEFEIELGEGSYSSIHYNENKKIGKYYIYLSLDKDALQYNIQDYRESLSSVAWIPLDIALVPIDDNSKTILDGFNNVYYNNRMGIYYVSRIWLNLSKDYKEVTDNELYQFGIKKPINVEDLKNEVFPTGLIEIDMTHDVEFNFKDRHNANKFKKAIYDIFSGKIDYRMTSDNPGGLRDEVFDELSDEYGLDIGQLFRFTESLKKIRLNSLYKD